MGCNFIVVEGGSGFGVAACLLSDRRHPQAQARCTHPPRVALHLISYMAQE